MVKNIFDKSLIPNLECFTVRCHLNNNNQVFIPTRLYGINTRFPWIIKTYFVRLFIFIYDYTYNDLFLFFFLVLHEWFHIF